MNFKFLEDIAELVENDQHTTTTKHYKLAEFLNDRLTTWAFDHAEDLTDETQDILEYISRELTDELISKPTIERIHAIMCENEA